MQFITDFESGEGATIFNYHNITWFPEDAEIGIFAGRKESEQCYSGFDVNDGK